MSTALLDHQAQAGAGNGGVPARRAVIRWSWRMFRREWRQQTLVLALIVVALAATVVGAAVATNTPPRAGAPYTCQLSIICPSRSTPPTCGIRSPHLRADMRDVKSSRSKAT